LARFASIISSIGSTMWSLTGFPVAAKWLSRNLPDLPDGWLSRRAAAIRIETPPRKEASR
jgi:hypothetical protein